jgi:hypothetical protein
MMNRLRAALRRASNPALRFNRPLVLFQSDDWGRVGVRDRDGWEELTAAGVNLGVKAYDFYSLETAGDLEALAGTLRNHRDSAGRHPSIVMNFIMANVDFDNVDPAHNQIPLHPLTQGLPGKWHRPGLFDAYQAGIRDRLFYPALHGLTHFCEPAVSRELKIAGERSELVAKLWRAQTPYIHWRMPWIGFEYWDPEKKPARQFLTISEQKEAISRAADCFRTMFNSSPLSACAPGYRSNPDSKTAWSEAGVRVVQNGPGDRKALYLDEREILSTFRAIEMEPALGLCHVEQLMKQAEACFHAGVPAVVSIHSINFHSTIRDFRSPTLRLLNDFLAALENKWPDLLYLNDSDLFSIATKGTYTGETGPVNVPVTSTGGHA